MTSRIIITICLITISLALVLPKNTYAAVPIVKVEDVPGTLRDSANKIAWQIAKLLVHNLTQQIVNLIRTGGQGGSPLFVTNWQDFLLDAADQAGGKFLEELKLTSLCQPFAVRIRLLLAGGRRPFHERARCTISDVLRNIEAFYRDFSNGGWARWFEITQIPQNNFYGAYYLAMEEKLLRESAAVEASLNQAQAGSGFLNLEECKDVETVIPAEDPEQGSQIMKVPVCDTVSPGKWLEKRLSEATNSDIKQLNLADSFNEIILAAFQSLINNLYFQTGGLRSSDISSINVSRDLSNLGSSGITISGVDAAINTLEKIIKIKKASKVIVQDTITILRQLRSCRQSKGESLVSVDNLLATATSTKISLESDITNSEILLETLKDDRIAMLNAETVEEFQNALSKTQEDVAKVGILSEAEAQKNDLTQIKSQAKEDLSDCLKPPEE